jgi:hypothetical protein
LASGSWPLVNAAMNPVFAAISSGELDDAYQRTREGLTPEHPIHELAGGGLRVEQLDALPEPATLTTLRERVDALLPTADLPDLVQLKCWDHPPGRRTNDYPAFPIPADDQQFAPKHFTSSSRVHRARATGRRQGREAEAATCSCHGCVLR